MDDDGHRFYIVLACPPHGPKEVSENVGALLLLSDRPDIPTALHFKYDGCAPALFLPH
jgi:hypothetical protein